MGVTSGFFDSVNNDRQYSAEQFGSLFTGIITDGVFSGVGEAFRVEANGSSVVVNTGRGWCRGTWINNDTRLILTGANNTHQNYSRYDMVCLEFDSSTAVRANTIRYIPGQSTASPVKPTPKSTSQLKQIPLAYVFRPAKATTVSQGEIQSVIGTSECPYITGPLATLKLDDQVKAANEVIRSANVAVQKLKTETVAELETVKEQAKAAKDDYLAWIVDAKRILGEAPNAEKIVQAAKDAADAKRAASQAQSWAGEARSLAQNMNGQFQTVKKNAEDALTEAKKYDARIKVLESKPSGGVDENQVNTIVDQRFKRTVRNYTTAYDSTNFRIPSDWNNLFSYGDFTGITVGWSIKVDRVYWRVAAFDYFYKCGTQANNPVYGKHHIVFVPDEVFGTGAFSNSAPSGYISEKNTLGYISGYVTAFNDALKEANLTVVEMKDYVSSGFGSDNRTNNSVLKNSYMWLMTESMIFGHPAWGHTTKHDSGWRDDQFPLFFHYPEYRRSNKRYWVRNFLTSTIPMGVDAEGRPDGWLYSTTDVGYRPYVVVAKK